MRRSTGIALWMSRSLGRRRRRFSRRTGSGCGWSWPGRRRRTSPISPGSDACAGARERAGLDRRQNMRPRVKSDQARVDTHSGRTAHQRTTSPRARAMETREMFANTRRHSAFSLIELVIVVVIIGIIAAIAIPRMSRGATGAADGALTADLATLRNSIDLYQAEHGGTFPDLVTSANYLVQYTDDAGGISATKDST